MSKTVGEGATGVEAIKRKKKRQFNKIVFKRRKILWDLIIKGQVLKKPLSSEDVSRASHGGTFGHWWIVIKGEDKSYGWWPHEDDELNLITTIKGVRGILNSGDGDKDPHHEDDTPDEEFVMIVEKNDSRSQEDLIKEIIAFAKGFISGWAYPARGNYDNCHSFQKKELDNCNFYQKGRTVKRDSKGNITDKGMPTPPNVEEVS